LTTSSSPPVPLSPRERGDDARSPESLPQQRFEALARDIAISDADHAVAGGFEDLGAGSIVGLSVAPVVRVALEFQDEPRGDAMES
jgi:hypothetical protein